MPGEREQREGEDRQRCVADEGEGGAEDNVHLVLLTGVAVANVDGGEGEDEGGDEEVAETEVAEEDVVGRGVDPGGVLQGDVDDVVEEDAEEAHAHQGEDEAVHLHLTQIFSLQLTVSHLTLGLGG